MSINDFIIAIDSVKINPNVDNILYNIYSIQLPEIIKKIFSVSQESIFFSGLDFCRLLSLEEVQNAEKQLHINFIEKKIIPIFDTGDNNFIVFNIKDSSWAKFNIVDEILYFSNRTFKDILNLK